MISFSQAGARLLAYNHIVMLRVLNQQIVFIRFLTNKLVLYRNLQNEYVGNLPPTITLDTSYSVPTKPCLFL